VRRAGGEVPARARGDPAAERRELERLRVEAHGHPVLAQLTLELGPGQPRARARRARHGVDLVHAVERRQRQRHGAVEARRDARLDPADDARPAADRDDGDVGARRPLQRRLDLALVAREEHGVGRVGDLAAHPVDDVGVRAAEPEARAVEVVGGGRAHVRRRHARRRQPHALQRHGLLYLVSAEAEVLGEPGRRRAQLVERRLLVGEPPTPVLAPAFIAHRAEP
jgi:hypothetical protein